MQYTKDGIFLSGKGSLQKNVLEYNRTFYRIEPLDPKFPKSRGGNSSVFKLVDTNTEKEYAIKFFKYPVQDSVKENIRFEREIDALMIAKSKGFEYVIDILFDGQKSIDGKTFRYYVMEKAQYDLRSFIIKNKIGLDQKILLCYELIKGIKELHSIDIYHRDIKPDNIFFVERDGKSSWKIGDLGLITFRGEDLKSLEFQKKVGPIGWLSPEAMNKVLCEGTRYESENDCFIDSYSDVFHLGQVFWFIFKYCIPIGQVEFADFNIQTENLYENIFEMIQHKKTRRGDIELYYDEFMELVS